MAEDIYGSPNTNFPSQGMGQTPTANPTTPGGEPGVVTPPPTKKGLPKIAFILGGIILGVVVFGVLLSVILGRVGGGGEVTLTWWGLWEDENVVSPLITEYQAAHPKIKINYVRQSQQDYRERLTNALAKGTGPDIFRFHNTWVPMFKSDLDFLPSTVISPGDYAQTFYTTASSDLSYREGIVGIPLEYDGLVLYLNEDIFSQAAKTVPTTWDELRQTALALTIKNEQGTITQAGVALGRTENVDHWPEILGLMMLQNGVKMGQPTGKLAEDALTFFTLFSKSDGVWDATLPPSTTLFASGKLAMYLGPSWRALEIKQQNPSLNFKTYPVPQLPKTGAKEPDITYATYWAEGVWARSKNKEAAWDFLKFLSSKASLEKMYQAASRQRLFGEPYSRVDMADLLKSDPILGSLVTQAPYAQSWYLASRTFDGPTGINSQINKYFEDAINAVNDRSEPSKVLETVAAGVTQVLAQYGIAR
jgi:multiple sugar transport system substrate-binding protein